MEAILIQEAPLSLICDFLDCDEDVLRFVGASKAARLSISLLHGTAGAVYFGREGIYGLWRHLSLQMVSASCLMWRKLEFIDDCKFHTPELVELCVAAMQKASFYANAQSKYFLVTIDQTEATGDDYRFAFIPSLGFCICLMYDSSGVMTYFQRREWEQDSDEESEKELLAPYQGIAVLATNNGEPLRIPSDSDIESSVLEAMRHRPTFVVVIWKRDGTAVTQVPHYRW